MDMKIPIWENVKRAGIDTFDIFENRIEALFTLSELYNANV